MASEQKSAHRCPHKPFCFPIHIILLGHHSAMRIALKRKETHHNVSRKFWNSITFKQQTKLRFHFSPHQFQSQHNPKPIKNSSAKILTFFLTSEWCWKSKKMYKIVGFSNQGKTIRLCATIIMYTSYDLRVMLYK